MPPENDTFQFRAKRLATFKDGVKIGNSKIPKQWTLPQVDINHLADLGFHYTPTKKFPDQVTCYWCGRKEKTVEGVQNIASFHLANSKLCPYALILSFLEKFVVDSDKDTYWQRLADVGAAPASILHPHTTASTQLRQQTFKKLWKFDKRRKCKVTSRGLAKAGFYYSPLDTGSDRVICMYCDCPLEEWDPQDDPLEEHRKNSFAFCYFLDTIGKEPIKIGTPLQSATDTEESITQGEQNDDTAKSVENSITDSPMNLTIRALQSSTPSPAALHKPAMPSEFDAFDFSIEDLENHDLATIFHNKKPQENPNSKRYQKRGQLESFTTKRENTKRPDSGMSLVLEIKQAPDTDKVNSDDDHANELSIESHHLDNGDLSYDQISRNTDSHQDTRSADDTVTTPPKKGKTKISRYSDSFNASMSEIDEVSEFTPSFSSSTNDDDLKATKNPKKRKALSSATATKKQKSQFSDDDLGLNQEKLEEILNSPRKGRKMKTLKPAEEKPPPTAIFDLSNQNIGDYDEENLSFLEKNIQTERDVESKRNDDTKVSKTNGTREKKKSKKSLQAQLDDMLKDDLKPLEKSTPKLKVADKPASSPNTPKPLLEIAETHEYSKSAKEPVSEEGFDEIPADFPDASTPTKNDLDTHTKDEPKIAEAETANGEPVDALTHDHENNLPNEASSTKAVEEVGETKEINSEEEVKPSKEIRLPVTVSEPTHASTEHNQATSPHLSKDPAVNEPDEAEDIPKQATELLPGINENVSYLSSVTHDTRMSEEFTNSNGKTVEKEDLMVIETSKTVPVVPHKSQFDSSDELIDEVLKNANENSHQKESPPQEDESANLELEDNLVKDNGLEESIPEQEHGENETPQVDEIIIEPVEDKIGQKAAVDQTVPEDVEMDDPSTTENHIAEDVEIDDPITTENHIAQDDDAEEKSVQNDIIEKISEEVAVVEQEVAQGEVEQQGSLSSVENAEDMNVLRDNTKQATAAEEITDKEDSKDNHVELLSHTETAEKTLDGKETPHDDLSKEEGDNKENIDNEEEAHDDVEEEAPIEVKVVEEIKIKNPDSTFNVEDQSAIKDLSLSPSSYRDYVKDLMTIEDDMAETSNVEQPVDVPAQSSPKAADQRTRSFIEDSASELAPISADSQEKKDEETPMTGSGNIRQNGIQSENVEVKYSDADHIRNNGSSELDEEYLNRVKIAAYTSSQPIRDESSHPDSAEKGQRFQSRAVTTREFPILSPRKTLASSVGHELSDTTQSSLPRLSFSDIEASTPQKKGPQELDQRLLADKSEQTSAVSQTGSAGEYLKAAQSQRRTKPAEVVIPPVNLEIVASEIETLLETIEYLAEVSATNRELHDDAEGLLTRFIAAMPEEEETMSISDWMQHNAKACGQTVRDISERMIRSYEESFDQVIKSVERMATRD